MISLTPELVNPAMTNVLPDVVHENCVALPGQSINVSDDEVHLDVISFISVTALFFTHTCELEEFTLSIVTAFLDEMPSTIR